MLNSSFGLSSYLTENTASQFGHWKYDVLYIRCLLFVYGFNMTGL
jgi:hypothetical protein